MIKSGDPVKFVYLTQAQYDALSTPDETTVYFVSANSGNSIYVGQNEQVSNSGVESRVTALETWRDGLIDGDTAEYGG